MSRKRQINQITIERQKVTWMHHIQYGLTFSHVTSHTNMILVCLHGRRTKNRSLMLSQRRYHRNVEFRQAAKERYCLSVQCCWRHSAFRQLLSDLPPQRLPLLVWWDHVAVAHIRFPRLLKETTDDYNNQSTDDGFMQRPVHPPFTHSHCLVSSP